MIAMIQLIPAGNGLKIILHPPAKTVRIRLLRRDDSAFTGESDPAALLINDGKETYIVDTAALYNGHVVYYCAYYFDGTNWTASAVVSATPNANFADMSSDAMTVVRDRIELGLQVYVDRGLITPSSGRIPVMTASPLVETTPMPLITIHLASDSSEDRFIGDMVANDIFDSTEWKWHSQDAYFSRVQLTIIAWCLNADERIILRNALKTVMISNFAVFDAAGLMQVDIQFSDQEDFVSYAAPIYQAVCNFTCYAASVVDSVDPAIRDLTSNLTPII